ncbi:Importin-11 [Lobulomyces angularis]|nr:Importin-11 [Lobulomyces angularis]
MDLNNVFNELTKASSLNTEIRKEGEEILKQMETHPNFLKSLVLIYCNKNLDLKIRFLSIAYFKNGIDKYWRKTAKFPVSEMEKSEIRELLLSNFQEEEKKLATQSSVAIAKISRFDYPLYWPDLLHRLMNNIQHNAANNNSILVQQNCLITFHQVIKTLCSRSLMSSRKMLQQLAPDILSYLTQNFYSNLNLFLSTVEGNTSPDEKINSINFLKSSTIILRTLRRLSLHGFKDFEANEDNVRLFGSLLEYLKKFLQLRLIYSNSGSLLTSIDLFILKIGKFYLEIVKEKPVNFLSTPNSILVIKYYWSLLDAYLQDETKEFAMYERFLVQGMIIIKCLIKNSDFTLVRKDEDTEKRNQIKQYLTVEFFTPDFVDKMLKTLVTKYLVIAKEDLEHWQDDPESFVQEEEADHWEYNIRACTEKLIMDLFTKNKEILSPVVISMLSAVSENACVDLKSILLKEAVYRTVGLVSHDLYNHLDFDNWFNSRLIAESTNHQHKRRIAVVIGNWISVKASKEIRGSIYTVLLSLMKKEEDLCTRLTAVYNLKICVDDWDFEVDKFFNYFETSLNLFLSLINDTEEFESKIKVLNCLSVIIERMEEKILPFARTITSILPDLWTSSEGQHMFRSAIIVILKSLVKSLKGESLHLQEFVVPLIQSGVDTTQPGHIYLIDDAIELWLSVVQNSPQPTEVLFALLPFGIKLMEYGTDSLKAILKIVEAYILLNPLSVLQIYAISIFTSLSQLIGSLKPEASKSILHLLDVTIQVCSRDLNLLKPLEEVLSSTGLLTKLLELILLNEEMGFILCSYLSIFARLTLFDANFCITFCKYSGGLLNPPLESVLPMLINAWVEKFDSMAHPKERKLSALALASLLIDNAIIDSKLELILNVLSSVVAEISGDLDNAQIYWKETRGGEEEELFIDTNSFHEARLKELQKFDPVYQENLKTFLNFKLSEYEKIFNIKFGSNTSFRSYLFESENSKVFETLKLKDMDESNANILNTSTKNQFNFDHIPLDFQNKIVNHEKLPLNTSSYNSSLDSHSNEIHHQNTNQFDLTNSVIANDQHLYQTNHQNNLNADINNSINHFSSPHNLTSTSQPYISTFPNPFNTNKRKHKIKYPQQITSEFEWKIPNFIENYCVDKTLDSLLFNDLKVVSNPIGPEFGRMQIVLFPRGIGAGKSTHLSFFLRPIKNSKELEMGSNWERKLTYCKIEVTKFNPFTTYRESYMEIDYGEGAMHNEEVLGFKGVPGVGFGEETFLSNEDLLEVLDYDGSLNFRVSVSQTDIVEIYQLDHFYEGKAFFAVRDSFLLPKFGPKDSQWELEVTTNEDDSFLSIYLLPVKSEIENELGGLFRRVVTTVDVKFFAGQERSALVGNKIFTGSFVFSEEENLKLGWKNFVSSDKILNPLDTYSISVSITVDPKFNQNHQYFPFSQALSSFSLSAKLNLYDQKYSQALQSDTAAKLEIANKKILEQEHLIMELNEYKKEYYNSKNTADSTENFLRLELEELKSKLNDNQILLKNQEATLKNTKCNLLNIKRYMDDTDATYLITHSDSGVILENSFTTDQIGNSEEFLNPNIVENLKRLILTCRSSVDEALIRANDGNYNKVKVAAITADLTMHLAELESARLTFIDLMEENNKNAELDLVEIECLEFDLESSRNLIFEALQKLTLKDEFTNNREEIDFFNSFGNYSDFNNKPRGTEEVLKSYESENTRLKQEINNLNFKLNNFQKFFMEAYELLVGKNNNIVLDQLANLPSQLHSKINNYDIAEDIASNYPDTKVVTFEQDPQMKMNGPVIEEPTIIFEKWELMSENMVKPNVNTKKKFGTFSLLQIFVIFLGIFGFFASNFTCWNTIYNDAGFHVNNNLNSNSSLSGLDYRKGFIENECFNRNIYSVRHNMQNGYKKLLYYIKFRNLKSNFSLENNLTECKVASRQIASNISRFNVSSLQVTSSLPTTLSNPTTSVPTFSRTASNAVSPSSAATESQNLKTRDDVSEANFRNILTAYKNLPIETKLVSNTMMKKLLTGRQSISSPTLLPDLTDDTTKDLDKKIIHSVPENLLITTPTKNILQTNIKEVMNGISNIDINMLENEKVGDLPFDSKGASQGEEKDNRMINGKVFSSYAIIEDTQRKDSDFVNNLAVHEFLKENS